jgi:DMSO reductase anchor subunit
MPEWGTQPANHYLPRRKTRCASTRTSSSAPTTRWRCIPARLIPSVLATAPTIRKLVLVFPLPVLLLWAGLFNDSTGLLVAAMVVQYVGLLFERWFFFAQANHPQNLYYQVIG